MDETLFSINGKIVPEDRARIPVTDRGFLYGDGLFETMHAYGRRLFRTAQHLERLSGGARVLAFDPEPDTIALARWMQEAVGAANFSEANVRLTYTRGSGPRGPSIKGPFTPTVVIMVTRYHRPHENSAGASAIVASFRRQESAATTSLKSLNYLEQILARREADLAHVDEALLLNNAGLLCEGSASNISIVRNGAVAVPDPQRSGALPGIAQLTALEAARTLKLNVVSTSLSPWDAYECDEAFLTGSMREITPLVRVGSHVVGSGKPGPITKALIAEFRCIVERECQPFKYRG